MLIFEYEYIKFDCQELVYIEVYATITIRTRTRSHWCPTTQYLPKNLPEALLFSNQTEVNS